MEGERGSIDGNETFTLTNLLKDRHIVRGAWVFASEENASGDETYRPHAGGAQRLL